MVVEQSFEGRRNKQSTERNTGESHQWELARNRRHNPLSVVATRNQQYAVLRNEKSQLEERNMQCVY